MRGIYVVQLCWRHMRETMEFAKLLTYVEGHDRAIDDVTDDGSSAMCTFLRTPSACLSRLADSLTVHVQHGVLTSLLCALCHTDEHEDFSNGDITDGFSRSDEPTSPLPRTSSFPEDGRCRPGMPVNHSVCALRASIVASIYAVCSGFGSGRICFVLLMSILLSKCHTELRPHNSVHRFVIRQSTQCPARGSSLQLGAVPSHVRPCPAGYT